ncbi:hypothetical protein F5X99DRAFT_193120 [Biscogniauxia marginata]|nr:hypothetical protein F5X99DRAFT_193120 [Biscogniauxia marginata]
MVFVQRSVFQFFFLYFSCCASQSSLAVGTEKKIISVSILTRIIPTSTLLSGSSPPMGGYLFLFKFPGFFRFHGRSWMSTLDGLYIYLCQPLRRIFPTTLNSSCLAFAAVDLTPCSLMLLLTNRLHPLDFPMEQGHESLPNGDSHPRKPQWRPNGFFRPRMEHIPGRPHLILDLQIPRSYT